MIEQAAKMELAKLRHVKFDGLESSELTRQEMLIGISGGRISIKKAHEQQKQPRVNVLFYALENCGIDLNKMNCKFIVNMTDGMETSDSHAPRLCFSQIDGNCGFMIPDAHFLNSCDLVSKISSMDLQWEEKEDMAIFIGSDTGLFKTAEKNQRFNFVYKNRKNPKGRFAFSNIVELDKDSLEEYEIYEIYEQRMSIPDQLRYKFIINMDGNSTSWDRILWAMASDSLCIYIRPQIPWRSWYYNVFDLCDNGLVYADEDSWESVVDYFVNNPQEAKRMSKLQKNTSFFIQNIENQLEYFKTVLEEYNRVYNER